MGRGGGRGEGEGRNLLQCVCVCVCVYRVKGVVMCGIHDKAKEIDRCFPCSTNKHVSGDITSRVSGCVLACIIGYVSNNGDDTVVPVTQ